MSPQSSPSTPKAKPYPHTIPVPPVLSEEIAKSLNPFAVLEFIRIEALLRSKLIFTYLKWSQKDWKETSPNEDYKEASLREDFHFSLHDSLHGRHHALLIPNAGEYRIGLVNFPVSTLPKQTGVWDLTKGIKNWPMEIDLGQEVRRKVTDPNRRLVEIDVAFPPTTILNALEEQLSTWHKGVSDSDKQKAKTELRSKPIEPITWIDYFKCYDLREEKGIPFGAIAKQVYGSGDPKERARKRDRAEKAYSRVQGIIKLAEQNQWPPPKSFSG